MIIRDREWLIFHYSQSANFCTTKLLSFSKMEKYFFVAEIWCLTCSRRQPIFNQSEQKSWRREQKCWQREQKKVDDASKKYWLILKNAKIILRRSKFSVPLSSILDKFFYIFVLVGQIILHYIW